MKEMRIDPLKQKYELFKIRSDDTITMMADRFNEIATRLKQLDYELNEEDLVKKMLSVLIKNYKPKVTAIKEAKDL